MKGRGTSSRFLRQLKMVILIELGVFIILLIYGLVSNNPTVQGVAMLTVIILVITVSYSSTMRRRTRAAQLRNPAMIRKRRRTARLERRGRKDVEDEWRR